MFDPKSGRDICQHGWRHSEKFCYGEMSRAVYHVELSANHDLASVLDCDRIDVVRYFFGSDLGERKRSVELPLVLRRRRGSEARPRSFRRSNCPRQFPVQLQSSRANLLSFVLSGLSGIKVASRLPSELIRAIRFSLRHSNYKNCRHLGPSHPVAGGAPGPCRPVQFLDRTSDRKSRRH